MNKKLMLLILILLITLTGCSGGDNTQTATNHKPTITSLTEIKELKAGKSVELHVEAVDEDGDELVVSWVVEKGKITGEGNKVTYTAPSNPIVDTVTVLVQDGKDNTKASLSINVIVPLINSIEIAKNKLMTAEIITLSADLGEVASIEWVAEYGTIEGTGNEVTYLAPNSEVNDTITLTVEDENGKVESEEVSVTVAQPYLNLTINAKEYLFVDDSMVVALEIDTNQTINSITWNSLNGTITGADQEVTYTSSDNLTDTISVTVKGQYSNTEDSLVVEVLGLPTLTNNKNILTSNEQLSLTIDNTTNQFVESVNLSAEYGTIDNGVYTAPNTLGEDTITLTVNYLNGESKTTTHTVNVEKLINVSGKVSLQAPKYSFDDINGYDYNPYFPTARRHWLVNGYLWHHVATGLNLVYEYNPNLIDGLKTVKVGVIDSGIDTDHPQLVNKVIDGINYIENTTTYIYDSNDWEDSIGHGTHIAGLIGAERSSNGVFGIAPNVEIMPIKVSDSGLADNSTVSRGINYGIAQNMKILNISIGFMDSPVLKEAIQEAYANNIIITASSGNRGANVLEYPAKYPEAFGVGGLTLDLTKIEMSDYGEGLDFIAPAWGVTSTWNDGDDYSMTGTSQAAPIVAGLSALVLGKYPDYTPDQVKEYLKKYSFDLNTKGWDEYTGYGFPNAYHILSEKTVEDIVVFAGQRQGDEIVKLSEAVSVVVDNPTNLSDEGDYNVNATLSTNEYSIFGWLDINENNIIDFGDYLGEYDDSANIKLSPLEKDYI